MKLTEEQLKQYYADQGIDRSDLLSSEPIHLEELPPDTQLDAAGRSQIEGTVRMWNRLDPLEKIDAAGSMERRVLSGRTKVAADVVAEAWCAWLLLGRVRGGEPRRQVIEQIARGELTAADLRASRRRRGPRTPLTEEQKRDVAAFLAPIEARLRAKGITGVRRETTRERAPSGDVVTMHHITPVRRTPR